MSLNEHLKALIDELDRTHPQGFYTAQPKTLPNFVTAHNGHQRHFTDAAEGTLHLLANTLHGNDKKISAIIGIKEFSGLLKQSIADLHADGELSVAQAAEVVDARKRLEVDIQRNLANMPVEFTHYFPAWTLGMEADHPFTLGPVTIMTREHWLDTVNFSPGAIANFLSSPSVNAIWKDSVKQALKPLAKNVELEGLAKPIFSAIYRYPSILKITINGYERNLSRKIAEIVCKSALDGISLLFGVRELFFQQTLNTERLPPVISKVLFETNGYLWLPGTTVAPVIRHLDYQSVSDHLSKNGAPLAALARILTALVDPSASPHPNLARRWSTALDWMAEGNRESNSAVALAKIATSLDVLSCGGKFSGILEMLVHLTNVSPSTVVVKGPPPSTLKTIVKNIYDSGRSQILHGTHFDRLKSFELWKSHAASLASEALIETAVRLSKFTGLEQDKTFRTIPS
jgi:hypothetical protein